MKLTPFLALSALFFSGGVALGGSVEGKLLLPVVRGSKRIAVERYTGAISGKVAEPPKRIAGVWLTAPGLVAPPASSVVLFSQTGYQFEKSLLVIPRGAVVKFPNADPDYHNVFSLSSAKRFDLGRYKTGENPTPEVVFDKVGLISLRCEIHEHMRAQILVVESPYLTTTDAEGNFSLKNVPGGEYTLRAQLDKKNKWESKIVVPSKGSIILELPSP